MDINFVRGLFTLLMLILFIGIFLWAYSGRRKKDFDEAANLPLVDDEPARREDGHNQNRKGNRDE